MKYFKKLLSILPALCLAVSLLPAAAIPALATGGTLSGAGTEGDPYIIADTDDWSTFASNVNAGTNANAYYKLSDTWDNSATPVTTMAGTSSHKFSGNFDGNGKTLTVSFTNAAEHTATFAYIDGATIQNLTVAGEVSSSEHHHLAALISENSGTSYVTDVTVSATVNCTASGNQYCGGFATGGAGIQFTNCVYKGKINVGDASGGFCGWGESTTTLTDCLFAPAAGSSISGGGNFCNNGVGTVTRSYYTQQVASSTQGTRVYTSAPEGVTTEAVTATDGMTYYIITGYPTVTSIATAEQWDAFAGSVALGNDYSGVTVTLGADITVSTMVGTGANKFKGTFDGGGHTLTVNLTSVGEATAPFRYVDGATIKCLRTAGTVSASGNDKYAAGLIGISNGTVTVDRCISDVTVSSSIGGDGTHGGFVGKVDGTTNFADCLFGGKLLTTNGTNNCGGFVGWAGGKVTLNRCLYAPAAIETGETEIQSGSRTFYRCSSSNSGSSLTQCFFTRALGETQGSNGTAMTAAQLADALGFKWMTEAGRAAPVIDEKSLAGAEISGIASFYEYTGNSYSYECTVTAPDCKELVKDTHYTLALRRDGEAVGDVQAAGKYTLTVTATDDGGYTGSKTFTFLVREIPTQIETAEDWSYLAEALRSGLDFKDVTVTLKNDITVTEMVGTEDRPFNGVFNGGGHTLTLALVSNGQNVVAPFRYVDGATIRYLHTDGTVDAKEQKYAAGLIGKATGTVTVTTCRSSVAIRGDRSKISDKDATHGGFLAENTSGSSVTFTDCLFDGSISDPAAEKCGGFVGWRNSTLTFNNCLMAGTMSLRSFNSSATFNRNGSSELNNCYYKTPYGDVQGEKAPNTASDLQTRLGSNWEVRGSGVVPSLDPRRISLSTAAGLKSYYRYKQGDPIAIEYTVTAMDGTALTEGTHYTATLSLGDETVSTAAITGDYTLTITATADGGYVGSKTFRFTVYDGETLTSATTEMKNGTYIVTGDLTIDQRITVSGEVNLILDDGATLHAPKGIQVSGGNALTIFGGAAGSGKLLIDGVDTNNAGIGGSNNVNGGSVTVNGGSVTAKGGSYGAGIGGGRFGSGGTVTISGGTVTANGGSYSAGIGGGYYGSGTITVTISGGTVTANGGSYSAGIGGGYYGSGTITVTISGGKVTANGGSNSAGIGGGDHGSDTITVTISGGTVTANGGSNGGAGIGGGEYGSGTITVTISGGKVTANGSSNGGAGIGGGEYGSGATIQLGYQTADDSIQASSYSDTVTVESGRQLQTNDSTPVIVEGAVSDLSMIKGKKLTPRMRTVTFALAGGEGTAPAVQNVCHGLTATEPATAPTRTGYTFSAWQLDGEDYCFTYAITMNTTLTAAWTAHTYTVHFNGNGATDGGMSDQSFTYDAAQALTANGFVRAFTVTYEYNGATGGNATSGETATATFNGWATSADGEKVYGDAQSVRNLTAADKATFDLFAKWTDADVTLPTPSRKGYTFDGWYGDSGCKEKVADGGAAYTVSADVALYARWTANGYTVSFDKNADDATGTMDPQRFTYDEAEKALTANGFARTGYDFAGWATERDGDVVYTDGRSVQNLTADANGTVALYAVWTPHTYTVKFNGNGATSGSMDDQRFAYGTAQNLTAIGFVRAFTVTYEYNGATGGNDLTDETATATFNGWATSADGEKEYTDAQSVRNLTAADKATFDLFAKWTDADVTLPTPSRKGYTFDGWYGDSGCKEKVADGGAAYTVSADVTLYAKWTEIPTSVGGDVSGGTFHAEAVAPKGGLLIAAVYDGSGRLAGVKLITLAASDTQQSVDTGLAVTKGYTYKVMLVNASAYAPLCGAWSEKKA